MAKLIVVYWRDIPAQVIAKAGRRRVKRVLPERFALAIDRAAMRAGKGSSDAYLTDWRRDSRDCTAQENLDMELAVEQKADQLHREFPADFLERVTKAGGVIENLPGALEGT